MTQEEIAEFNRAAIAAAQLAARALHHRFSPGAPPESACAVMAQSFYDSTTRAMEAIGERDVMAFVVAAMDIWKTAVVAELARLNQVYRAATAVVN
jgi:hypothetical protein